VYHSNKDKLDLSDPDELKKFKVVQANDNAMAWLRMAFPLPKHQHEIDASCTTNFPQGVSKSDSCKGNGSHSFAGRTRCNQNEGDG
jgi:hypothetical protein